MNSQGEDAVAIDRGLEGVTLGRATMAGWILRANSAIFTPASAYLSTAMIFSSLNRDSFTRALLPEQRIYSPVVLKVRGLQNIRHIGASKFAPFKS